MTETSLISQIGLLLASQADLFDDKFKKRAETLSGSDDTAHFFAAFANLCFEQLPAYKEQLKHSYRYGDPDVYLEVYDVDFLRNEYPELSVDDARYVITRLNKCEPFAAENVDREVREHLAHLTDPNLTENSFEAGAPVPDRQQNTRQTVWGTRT
jgi:hypothetical protein